jgi:beta-N-acetylhexosaminidase
MPRIAGVIFVLLSLFILTSSAKDKYEKRGPVQLNHDGEKWAEKTLHKLSPEEKVGQLFVIWVRSEFLNISNPQYLALRDSIRKYHIGGLTMTVREEGPFLYKSEPYEAAELLNRLQKDSKLPLLISADFERGVAMRLNGATAFPHSMAFAATGKPEYAEAAGRITAEEARAIGVQWNFYPDADVNSNPANPVINVRSFGSDPQQVGEFVAAYVRGAQAAGMMTTAKHFPGHGDTATDSHLGVAQVTGDKARLQAVELEPFREAFKAGVDSVMVGHLSVPALDSDPNHVATTSPAITTGVLKDRLGFHGLVVTDALDMAGLTRLYAADIGREAVEAFKAGSDVLLIPPDLDACYRAVLAAVRSGEIPQSQLDASVLKILKAKASVGLNKARLVDLSQLTTEIGKPENLALGQQIADDAVTLVRDNGKLLPLKKSGTAKNVLPYQQQPGVKNDLVVVIFTDNVRLPSGHMFERQIRSRVPDANIMYVDSRIAEAMSGPVLKAVGAAKSVLAAVEVAPVPGNMQVQGNGAAINSAAMPGASGALLRQILGSAADHTVVIALGNPYLASDFPAVQNYMCTFSNEAISEISAAKALFGEIPIRGHLPVSIPGIAARGEGIERPAQTAQGATP